MKACGLFINVTVKAHSGEWRIKNLEESILATGLKIRNMEEVHSFTKMVTDTTATGSMECLRVKDAWSMQMRVFMKVSGMVPKETVTES